MKTTVPGGNGLIAWSAYLSGECACFNRSFILEGNAVERRIQASAGTQNTIGLESKLILQALCAGCRLARLPQPPFHSVENEQKFVFKWPST